MIVSRLICNEMSPGLEKNVHVFMVVKMSAFAWNINRIYHNIWLFLLFKYY